MMSTVATMIKNYLAENSLSYPRYSSYTSGMDRKQKSGKLLSLAVPIQVTSLRGYLGGVAVAVM